MSEINELILELNRYETVALSGKLNGKQIQPETQRKLNEFISKGTDSQTFTDPSVLKLISTPHRNIISKTQQHLDKYPNEQIPGPTGLTAAAKKFHDSTITAHNALVAPFVDKTSYGLAAGFAADTTGPFVKLGAIGASGALNALRRGSIRVGKLLKKEKEGQKNIKSNVRKYIPKQDPNTIDLISNMDTTGLSPSSQKTVDKIKARVNPFTLKKPKIITPLDDSSLTDTVGNFIKHIPGGSKLGNGVQNLGNTTNGILDDANRTVGTGMHHYDKFAVDALNTAADSRVPITTTIKRMYNRSKQNIKNAASDLYNTRFGNALLNQLRGFL